MDEKAYIVYYKDENKNYEIGFNNLDEAIIFSNNLCLDNWKNVKIVDFFNNVILEYNKEEN